MCVCLCARFLQRVIIFMARLDFTRLFIRLTAYDTTGLRNKVEWMEGCLFTTSVSEKKDLIGSTSIPTCLNSPTILECTRTDDVDGWFSPTLQAIGTFCIILSSFTHSYVLHNLLSNWITQLLIGQLLSGWPVTVTYRLIDLLTTITY